MSVKFEDNSIKVKGAINDAVIAFLNEAAGEVVSQTQRNSRVDTGQTKGSYTYDVTVDVDSAEAKIGSPLENAIWEEFGTGEYALNGDGRQGGWRYEDDNGQWHFTRGKSPNRPLYRAYTKLKTKIIKMAQSEIGAKLK